MFHQLQLGRRRWATDGQSGSSRPQTCARFNWAVAVGPRMGTVDVTGGSCRKVTTLQLGRRRWATDGVLPKGVFVSFRSRFNWAVAVGPRMGSRVALSE